MALETERDQRLEFIRALIHELRTPITSVMAGTEMLEMSLKEESSLTICSNILRGVGHLNDRIGELLDVAKGQVGRLQVDRVPGDLCELLEDVGAEMSPVASKQGKQLLVQLPSGLPEVHFDAQRIRQVVMNLLDNALKYTKDKDQISIGAELVGDGVVVKVADNGCGMSPEETGQLFKPYSLVRNRRSRVDGLGLGLSLCKVLVELHGGTIQVESEADRGSTFSFSLNTARSPVAGSVVAGRP
jgi:signal transduction histidine kinase